jgi:dihydrofolate synthase / folylpolyglutamate synthase
MDYEAAMDYINSSIKFGSNYGLSRTEKILELLGNPHKKLKCIHVAGTNGKGSTTAMISGILINAGYKVGMYTSPYLEEFEERIQINGHNIEKEKLSSILTEVSIAVSQVISLGYDHPTEFEIITCTAFLYFCKENVEVAVIEVGLGGRLDSTNVIVPIISVITSISYDHMQILGDTLEKIAFEKAGIIKPGIPVVLYPQEEESLNVFEKVSRNRGSRLIKVEKDCVDFIGIYDFNQRLRIQTSREFYDIELSLLGEHQKLNCATAIYTIEELQNIKFNITKDNIKNALKNIKWPGRLEIFNSERKPLVVIDGAHNIDGIKKLEESIIKYFKYCKIILILGILADKQVEEMIKTIVPLAAKVITVTPHSDRAQLCHELKTVVEQVQPNCEAIEDYELAFKKGISYCSDDDILLISGSLYMVGDMRKIIKKYK